MLHCVGVFGVITLLFGFCLRIGWFKAWYLAQGTPILVPRAWQGVLIPIGITFTVWEILYLAPAEYGPSLFPWLIGPLFFVTIILAMWQPRWLQPYWLTYLMDKYGDVTWYLLHEAAKNPQEWSQRVQTQTGLEMWAEETYQRLREATP
jgi:hypothetical protein